MEVGSYSSDGVGQRDTVMVCPDTPSSEGSWTLRSGRCGCGAVVARGWMISAPTIGFSLMVDMIAGLTVVLSSAMNVGRLGMRNVLLEIS